MIRSRELGWWKAPAQILFKVPSFALVSIINRLKKKLCYLVRIWEAEVWKIVSEEWGGPTGIDSKEDWNPLLPLSTILDSWPLLNYWRYSDSIRRKIFSRSELGRSERPTLGLSSWHNEWELWLVKVWLLKAMRSLWWLLLAWVLGIFFWLLW